MLKLICLPPLAFALFSGSRPPNQLGPEEDNRGPRCRRRKKPCRVQKRTWGKVKLAQAVQCHRAVPTPARGQTRKGCKPHSHKCGSLSSHARPTSSRGPFRPQRGACIATRPGGRKAGLCSPHRLQTLKPDSPAADKPLAAPSPGIGRTAPREAPRSAWPTRALASSPELPRPSPLGKRVESPPSAPAPFTRHKEPLTGGRREGARGRGVPSALHQARRGGGGSAREEAAEKGEAGRGRERGGGRLRGPAEHAALAAASLFWRFRPQPQPARSSALPLGDWAGAGERAREPGRDRGAVRAGLRALRSGGGGPSVRQALLAQAPEEGSWRFEAREPEAGTEQARSWASIRTYKSRGQGKVVEGRANRESLCCEGSRKTPCATGR